MNFRPLFSNDLVTKQYVDNSFPNFYWQNKKYYWNNYTPGKFNVLILELQ